MVSSVFLFLCCLLAAAGLAFWFIRKRILRVDTRLQELARLLLVSGNAFDDRNHELYAATMREIVNIMRSERWGREEIEARINRALLSAKSSSSPELFEKASRLAENIIQACSKSPTIAA